MLKLFSSLLSSEEIPQILWEEIAKLWSHIEPHCRFCLSSTKAHMAHQFVGFRHKRGISPARIAFFPLKS